ncbi:helix-turn-helix domain-containing protein [Parapedobacter tibetensis]|uniref:helix-turn-helix domain-containing protein n=1 Tax=Parapedobacter tibetensis TaxID=2972951 RepID=UPI00214D30FA|nr:helix-turn-helix domain-containing protein [Parapedobacter tibetensis]
MNENRVKREFILLNVGRAVHHADWNWKNIYSPFARIHLVESGFAEIVHDDLRYPLKKGYLYLTPPYTKHSYACTGDLSLYYIHIYEALGKQLSIFDILDFPVEIKADEIVEALIKRLVAVNPELELQFYDPKDYDNSPTLIKNISQHKHARPAMDMENEGILKLIISRFLAQASDKNLGLDERILQAIHYIHSNIDKPIKIEELAQTSCLTEDHFIRLFKKQMQCTPGKYINQKKIEQAQLMMLVKNVTIKELAYRLGFENISYFNRLFKKISGENPGKMQRKMLAMKEPSTKKQG